MIAPPCLLGENNRKATPRHLPQKTIHPSIQTTAMISVLGGGVCLLLCSVPLSLLALSRSITHSLGTSLVDACARVEEVLEDAMDRAGRAAGGRPGKARKQPPVRRSTNKMDKHPAGAVVTDCHLLRLLVLPSAMCRPRPCDLLSSTDRCIQAVGASRKPTKHRPLYMTYTM